MKRQILSFAVLALLGLTTVQAGHHHSSSAHSVKTYSQENKESTHKSHHSASKRYAEDDAYESADEQEYSSSSKKHHQSKSKKTAPKKKTYYEDDVKSEQETEKKQHHHASNKTEVAENKSRESISRKIHYHSDGNEYEDRRDYQTDDAQIDEYISEDYDQRRHHQQRNNSTVVPEDKEGHHPYRRIDDDDDLKPIPRKNETIPVDPSFNPYNGTNSTETHHKHHYEEEFYSCESDIQCDEEELCKPLSPCKVSPCPLYCLPMSMFPKEHEQSNSTIPVDGGNSTTVIDEPKVENKEWNPIFDMGDWLLK